MIEERSAGAIVFLPGTPGPQYLLLDNGGRLDFPKGQIENGEDELSAAQRETREETGLDTEFLDGFKEKVDYFYSRPGGVRVHKVVTFFIAESKGRDVKISREHQGYVWLPIEKALRHATYRTSKKLLGKADSFVRSRVLQRGLDSF